MWTNKLKTMPDERKNVMSFFQKEMSCVQITVYNLCQKLPENAYLSFHFMVCYKLTTHKKVCKFHGDLPPT